ncbi:aldehyde dehydrogenase family protein [Radiobacillus kanasensis]|uniref:aldehyde dehydrogenase family protein n=1 Tax=Radiobacillus kanasensis TaxID=2844358 RepID=UPI001E5041E0|nr:aldehyde dehydrogenase family protein [Radiobacillus kanasensis]UFT99180.1 aldehyde dehydrogenase family protein [Radiobacillus kanasensis]
MQTKIRSEKMLLAGEWMRGEKTFDVYDPQDNQVIAKVPKATKENMLDAIEKAQDAFEEHTNWPTHERIRVLKDAAAYMEAHSEKYAQTIASEGSKTIREARGEVRRAIQTIQISSEEARRLSGETIQFDQNPGSENRVGYSYRFPIGVIGAITPFNDPLNLVAHKVGPAIAAGNAVVVKPASVTPLSALLLAEAFMEAGLPKGLLSVVTGSGAEIGDPLITHPDVKMVSFTGGLDAGKSIANKTGIKKMNMELGSNSPVIVMDDADLSLAVDACVSGAFSAVGQNCIGVQRIYVQEDAYESFLSAFIDLTSQLVVGDKLDEFTDMGPMIQEKEAKRVESWVAEAILDGAHLEYGGKRHGAFYEPTILTNVPPTSKVAREEVFGPVVIVDKIKSLPEAVEKSNKVNYGLQAGIFTSNLDYAHYAIQYLQVGGVMVNDSSDYRIDFMPFGGIKGSGLGREGVKDSIEAMTEPKVVCFRLKGLA